MHSALKGTGLKLAIQALQHIGDSARLYIRAKGRHLVPRPRPATSLVPSPNRSSYLFQTSHFASMSPKKAAKSEATTSPSPRLKRKAEAEADEGGEGAAAPAVSPKKTRASPKKKKAAELAVTVEADEGAEAAAAEDSEKRPKRATRKPRKAGDDEEQKGQTKKPAGKKAKKGPPGEVYTEAMRRPAPEGPATKILSWNVAGLRGLLKKAPGSISDLIKRESPDVVCLQEIKMSDQQVEDLQDALGLPAGWHAHWCCSQDKAGYSGVATFSRVKPLSVQEGLDMKEHDGEGRLIITEFKDFYLLNVYVPNSGEGLKRLDYRVGAGGWDASLAAAIKKLQKTKPVIVTGDLNCAHQEIDIHNPKTNLRSAGFTQEERDSFGSRYLSGGGAGGCGLVDTYRYQFPDIVAYTYYSYRFSCRAKGIGWRLDYCLASEDLMPRVHDSWLLPDVMGSDHVPLGLTLLGPLEGA